MSSRDLIIRGARQNNLRNISLRIPHNNVVAVTGVSGSGKSSLAFDTIFAEGQWRFIESLSSYARLFLEKLDRPDLDSVTNIRPAIALEQKNSIRGSRSTVGTLTELYDFFRLLYARVSTPCCTSCGREIRAWDPSQVAAELAEKFDGHKALILFETKDPPEEVKRRGFVRAWRDGEIAEPGPALQVDGTLSVVLDRLVIAEGPRLSDSVETAWKEGQGKIVIVIVDNRKEAQKPGQKDKAEAKPKPDSGPVILKYSAENACEDCGITLPEPSPLLFSFNHPVGACPVCKGFGDTLRYDEDLIVPDKSLSLAEGAVDPWTKPAAAWWTKQLREKGRKAGLDLDKPYADLDPKEKEILYKGIKGFYGIDAFFEELEGWKYKLHVRVFLSRYRRSTTCHACGGRRLRPEVLAYRIGGLDIAGLSAKPVDDLAAFFADLDMSPFRKEAAKELLRQTGMKLAYLRKVGLGYLTLNRHGKTLSGGEYQRINLSNQLASLLTGTLYVLDEPTIGLHARDTARIAEILTELAALGNTVIVVEHDRSIIEASDWVVELGPGGGHKGGNLVFEGTSREFLKAETLTAKYMRRELEVRLPSRIRHFSGETVTLAGACGNNLKDVTLTIPLKRLVAVTGVSGSGKSSLIVETLYRALARRFRTDNEAPLPFRSLSGEEHLRGVKLIDQSPIGRSPRSNPVTYLKIFDQIRKIFASQKEAKAHGYGPGFFSFNVDGGRCDACQGGGYQQMEMFFFEDLYITCEKCSGMRYKPEALRVTFREKNIFEVLNLTVEEALDLFGDYSLIRTKLSLLAETGLGYLRLGQAATTLSGGEAQRLKICAEMGTAAKSGHLYILDEPTVGLHFDDVRALLRILNRLVETGNTVVMIEHNPDLVRAADWVIDIGPEGGGQGGRLVFEGTPEELAGCDESHTGVWLKRYGI